MNKNIEITWQSGKKDMIDEKTFIDCMNIGLLNDCKIKKLDLPNPKLIKTSNKEFI